MNVVFTPQTVSIEVASPAMGIGIGSPVARDYVDRDPYTGEYTITPGDEEQVLITKNLRMTENITVKAVPSNYGKIDWNGQYLVVS